MTPQQQREEVKLTEKEQAAANKIVDALKPLPTEERERILRGLMEHRPSLGAQDANTLRLNDTTFRDWVNGDGKLVRRMDSLIAATRTLPPEAQRGWLEEAKNVLDQQISENDAELSARVDLRNGLENQIGEAQRAQVHIERPRNLRGLGEWILAIGNAPASRVVDTGAAFADPRGDASWILRLWSCGAIWRNAGSPTFEITGGLAAALCMTECGGLLGRDFKLPFSACAVQMPEPSPIVLPDGPARWLLMHQPNERELAVFGSAGGETITELMEANWPADMEPLAPRLRTSKREAIVRFVVNLCVYINSLHALPPPEGKRKPGARQKKRGHEPEPPQRWVLGREIKLSPGMMQAARAALRDGATAKQRAAFRVHARFMVRGHWRNQACGTKHSARRLRWIEPFWKGPEMADGLARLYSVEEKAAP